MTPAELATLIRARSEGRARTIVALAGPPGAGKSTLSAALQAQVPAARVVPMDGFHYDAHPMGMFISATAALGTFYDDAKDIFDKDSFEKLCDSINDKISERVFKAEEWLCSTVGRELIHKKRKELTLGWYRDLIRIYFTGNESSYHATSHGWS